MNTTHNAQLIGLSRYFMRSQLIQSPKKAAQQNEVGRQPINIYTKLVFVYNSGRAKIEFCASDVTT